MSLESKTNWQPTASVEVLKARARMLQNIRAFFAEQQVLEVETPVLSTSSITDPHLQSFQTRYLNKDYYLQTSPEFFMKRLLASGSGDIYQICKVFRDDEQGRNHNPEFTMLEWYRIGLDHHQLMDEVEQLFQKLIDQLNIKLICQPVKRVSYQQVFIDVLGIDPLEADAKALKQITLKYNIEIPVGMDELNKDMWLDWLMTQAIAPAFDKNSFTFLYDYPASQAALAKLNVLDPRTSHRFEVFFGELELANGFNELTDAVEQRERFESENKKRQELGMEQVSIDGHLLAALEQGMPECSGVAIGLDRLLMVLLGVDRIENVLSFGVGSV
ncbi:MAG: EF-P lysine aminoacylase EpmA [Gammaproteobacteria bacterium]|nr:EF-P lysine aminoacylase EpmA [Gammaproteobacteria bacterium]